MAMRMCVCALQVSRCTCRACRASCCSVAVGAAAMGGARGGDSGLVLTAASPGGNGHTIVDDLEDEVHPPLTSASEDEAEAEAEADTVTPVHDPRR